MKTRSQSQNKPYLPLLHFKESPMNFFGGQQICTIRNMDFESYYQSTRDDNPDHLHKCFQVIYDAACEMMDMGIVIYSSGIFHLNERFGDYDAWRPFENQTIKNCLFLQKMGHPQYCH